MNLKQAIMATPLYDLLGKRSYAQSGEDIIAFGEIGGVKQGFYVDVGAYHPKLFSNTYYFYKKGWRGVCVEPNPGMKILFNYARPRDTFLNLGVGKEGNMKYFQFEDGAANTFSESQAAKNQKEAGRKLVRTMKVPVKSLKWVLDKNLPKDQKIDLMSVDVEGMDLTVLKSNDWKKYKPRVIIAEDLSFDFGDSMKSEVVKFLGEMGYKLLAKTPYSIIFKAAEW